MLRAENRELARQLLNDVPVEHAAANKSHALAHHLEQDIRSLPTDRDHISYIHYQW